MEKMKGIKIAFPGKKMKYDCNFIFLPLGILYMFVFCKCYKNLEFMSMSIS